MILNSFGGSNFIKKNKSVLKNAFAKVKRMEYVDTSISKDLASIDYIFYFSLTR